MMAKTILFWLLSLAMLLPSGANLAQAQEGDQAKPAKRKTVKKTKRRLVKKAKPRPQPIRTSGELFVSNSKFPLTADSDKELIAKGRKHSKKSLAWSSGEELSFYVLLVLRHPLGSSQLTLVLYQRGKDEYSDAQPFAVKPKVQRWMTTISFSGSYLKKGQQYELRAIRLTQRGKKTHEQVMARTFFSLK